MKIYPWAVLLGFLTDTVSSIVLSTIVDLLFIPSAAMSSTWFFVWSLVAGLATTALGGFVTSRKSVSYKYFNAALMGFASFVLGVVLTFANQAAPLWFHILSWALTIPAASLGGYIESRQLNHQEISKVSIRLFGMILFVAVAVFIFRGRDVQPHGASYACDDGAYFAITFLNPDKIQTFAGGQLYIFNKETGTSTSVQIFGNDKYAFTFVSTLRDQVIFTHRGSEPSSTICHKRQI